MITPPPSDFTLSDGDKISGLWLRLKLHLEQQLDEARRRNDGNLPEDETALLRGEIRALKRLIRLGDTGP